MEQTTDSFEEKYKKTKLSYIGLYSLLVLIWFSISLFVLLYIAQQKLVVLGDIRYQSKLLAEQLHQSSDDLTRLVRTYAITGNKKYEQQFWDVLAIRNGEKPRPLHYDRVYWDFLSVENGKPPYQLGKAVPLTELMKEAGFTEKEFSLLAEAQKNSDQLVKLEQATMNAMNGITTGESGEIPNDTSGQQVAIRILFGERYHQAKIEIMRHINMFFEGLEYRTYTEFTRQASLLQIFLISEIFAFALIICTVVFVLRTSKQYHAGMVSVLSSTVKDRTAELLNTNGKLTNEINVRVITEEKLKESELRLREMAENITSVFWMEDTDGNLLYTNRAYEQIWGRSCQSFYENPRSRLDAIHPDDRQRVDDSFSKWQLQGTYTENFRIIRPDGEIRSIYDRGYPIRNEKGEVYRIAGIAEDITERKQIEETLLQSEKLKSLGTITAGISHEFNNILNIISGNVQLLQINYKDHSELMDSFRIIEKSIDKGSSITDRMREFTHEDEDADTMDFVSADINELLAQAVEFTKPRWKNMAQARGVDYNVATEVMKNVSSILCNPIEIRDTFINIINNAIDAMPDGGRLSFRTWSKGDALFVSITDTGRGMSEDVKKNVFDPFFTTRRPEGTGLGMSTSYSKIVRHGGKIEVDSEVGKGSTFTIQFPLTIKTASPITTPEPKLETKGKKLSILVVDDEEEICNMLVEFLSHTGHKVKAVDSGAGAIELAKRERFDLVLCDIAMPNVFGYDVIKFLNKLEERPKIGIITGWGGKLKPIDDEGFKVDFIIKKSFELSELTKHINDLFGADSK